MIHRPERHSLSLTPGSPSACSPEERRMWEERRRDRTGDVKRKEERSKDYLQQNNQKSLEVTWGVTTNVLLQIVVILWVIKTHVKVVFVLRKITAETSHTLICVCYPFCTQPQFASLGLGFWMQGSAPAPSRPSLPPRGQKWKMPHITYSSFQPLVSVHVCLLPAILTLIALRSDDTSYSRGGVIKATIRVSNLPPSSPFRSLIRSW